MEAVNYDKKKYRNHVLGGCPGALGRLASKDMFLFLFGPAVRGGTQSRCTPTGTVDFLRHATAFWVEATLETGNYEHLGPGESWSP